MADDVFRVDELNNAFDHLIVDVQGVYTVHPLGRRASESGSAENPAADVFHRVYQSRWIPLRYRRAFWKLARQINLDIRWFHRFASYWNSVLGGRPLWGVQDFFFLMNSYRVQFQRNRIPDTENAEVHLQAWQQPEVLYQLFHLAYKESNLDHLDAVQHALRYKRKIHAFLEYGCGTAPIATSFLEFYGTREPTKIYIADIQTVAFHYAAYKFQSYSNVTPVLLVPENSFALSLGGPVDAIFCITVLEHLNSPLTTVRELHRNLAPGGLLLFDYIQSEGGGLDTVQSVRERRPALEFIQSNFDVLAGHIDFDHDMPLTVVRKR